jgi:hypothetical protein
MLRWLTAGESHGPALVALLEGLPAHVRVTRADIVDALARRRLGYGRGARMKFEQDEVEVIGGLRHGETLGSPVALRIGNTEWPKWEKVMSADPVDADELASLARNAPLTRPRPGHADLVGMQKYDFDEARPVLERASARETAARVALGEVAARFLEQSVGARVVSHVVAIGFIAARTRSTSPVLIPPSVPPERPEVRRMPASVFTISSCAFEPGSAARPKPSPTSTPLIAWMPISAPARRASSRRSQCTCEPRPGGRPWTTTSTTPPRVSPSLPAASISFFMASSRSRFRL